MSHAQRAYLRAAADRHSCPKTPGLSVSGDDRKKRSILFSPGSRSSPARFFDRQAASREPETDWKIVDPSLQRSNTKI